MGKVGHIAQVCTHITKVPYNLDLRDVQYRIMILRLDLLILLQDIRDKCQNHR